MVCTGRLVLHYVQAVFPLIPSEKIYPIIYVFKPGEKKNQQIATLTGFDLFIGKFNTCKRKQPATKF